ncbi:MAG: hypothetical protein ACLFQV_07155 [Vulcanimicrobiota bacterium]
MKYRSQKGIALISVLMVLTMLMVITMGFATFTTTDFTISQSYKGSTTCYYLAQAGLEYTRYLVSHNMLIYPMAPNLAGIVDPNHNAIAIASNTYMTDGYKPVGEEHMVISDLAFTGTDAGSGEGEVEQMLGRSDYFGTFQVSVHEKKDTLSGATTDDRVLYVKSVGKIRSKNGNDPATMDYTDNTLFPIIQQRTLLMRMPFRTNITTETGTSLFLFEDNSGNARQFKILNDGWFERFR